MFRRLSLLFGIVFHLTLCFSLRNLVFASPALPELAIYTYDSFVASGGLGPAILPLFEKKYGCHVRYLSSGDAGQMLTRLQLDFKNGKVLGQLIVGLDQHSWKKAKPWIETWGDWIPRGYAQIIREVRIDLGFMPYDYSPLTWIVDRKILEEMHLKIPTSLGDLLKPEWKRKIILEDPRASPAGLAFLLFVDQVFGSSSENFWEKFRGQWLTLQPSWDAAYGLFLRNEAPLVWSYLTSQAFHQENGDPSGSARRYQAILFKEGQPVQVEGAACVKGAFQNLQQKLLAQHFLEFLVSTEVQALIPRTNWMIPVIQNREIPESFKNLPELTRLVPIYLEADRIEKAIDEWNRVVYSSF